MQLAQALVLKDDDNSTSGKRDARTGKVLSRVCGLCLRKSEEGVRG